MFEPRVRNLDSEPRFWNPNLEFGASNPGFEHRSSLRGWAAPNCKIYKALHRWIFVQHGKARDKKRKEKERKEKERAKEKE